MKIKHGKNGTISFTAENDEDSLNLLKFLSGPNPSPETAALIEGKEAKLSGCPNEHKVIEFEDHDQDFLRWTVNEKGVVIDCEPFQASIWCGCKVLNVKTLKVGGQVKAKKATWETPLWINYPIENLRTIEKSTP